MTTTATELPALNTVLLEKILVWAAKEARNLDLDMEFGDEWGTWDQNAWAEQRRNGICQTSYCIAGQAVNQEGYVMLLQHVGRGGQLDDQRDDQRTYHDIYRASACAPAVLTGEVDSDTGHPVIQPNPDIDTHRDIEVFACELLGITRTEGKILFNGRNSIGDVVKTSIAIARRRGVTLNLPQPVKSLARHARHAYGDLEYLLDD